MVSGETDKGGGVTRRAVLKSGATVGVVASLGVAGISGAVAAKKNNAVPITGPTTITTPGYYVLTRDIVGEGSITVEPGVNDVTIDGQGYTLSGDGTVSTGIYVGEELGSATDNITIKNVHITEFTRDGVELLFVNGGTIQNVVFSGNTFQGIFWAECSDVTVEDCTFSDNGMASFGYGCSGLTFVRNDITNSVGITFGDSFGISVAKNNFEYSGPCVWFDESSTGVEIVKNRMERSSTGVKLEYVYEGLIRGNQFVDNDGTAISTEEVSGIVIEKNNILRNGGDGVSLGEFSNTSHVVKNRILDNAGDGIELQNADDNVIEKNVIKRNGGVPLNVSADSTGNVIEDNRV